MLMRAHSSLLLVIDMQEKLAPAIAGIEEVQRNAIALLTAAARMRVPTLITEHCPDRIGATVGPIRALVEETAIVTKTRFSAQSEPAAAQRIATPGRKDVIIAGTETHVCVLQTTLGLKEAGYRPCLVLDATSSRRALDKDAAVARLRAHGVEIVTLEMVLFEWLERGDTREFREMLPLIRDR